MILFGKKQDSEISKYLSVKLRPCKNIKAAVAVILSLLIISAAFLSVYTQNLNTGLSDNLIRLHIIANSDSTEDQALKRDVRDAVIDYMQDELKGSTDIEQAKTLLNERLDDITGVAESTIQQHGRSDKVYATLGNFPFPTKSYGDIKLPAGNYQALRVVIGNGKGANWWCVLFPPLCFVDVTHGTVPASAKENLKKVLTEEEYDIVTMADDADDIPIKIKFKIVELFQDSRVKFADALSRLFGNAG